VTAFHLYAAPMQHAEVTLPGVASSVPIARHFVESVLSSWRQPELAWTATLIVSELGANCALHARTEFTVRVSLESDHAVRLEVSDGSLRLPRQRSFGLESTTGRGLRLVAELATDWGVESGSHGKTLWVRLTQPSEDVLPEDGADVDVDALLATFGEDDGSPVAATDALHRLRGRRDLRRAGGTGLALAS